MRISDSVVAGRHGTVPTRLYGDGPARLLWLHGGAFAYGDLDMPEAHAVAVALAELGHGVLTVDYRRVPRFSWWREPRADVLPGTRYPVPLDDVLDVVAALTDSSDVVIGGASAGACLAAAAALRARDEGRTRFAGLVLAYGTFHAALPEPGTDLRRRVRGRHGLLQLRPRTVRLMNNAYAGSLTLMEAPYAFPGGKDLTDLPRSLLLDADRDTLRASGEAFRDELAAAGVDVVHRVLAGSRHGFLNRPSQPFFDDAVSVIADFLDG